MVVVDAVTVSFIENELPISEKFHVTRRAITSTFQLAKKKRGNPWNPRPETRIIFPSFPPFRSILHFRVHILIRKVCRIVSETSVFRLDHRGSIRRGANVSNQPRSFFEKRSILTRVDESCLPFAWNVSIYLGGFRFRDVSTHGTNRAKNGFDRWAKNLEEERKGKRRKKKKDWG